MPQAESVAIPKRLPLIVEPANRDETTLKDAKLINGYVEKGREEGEYWIYKRPGTLAWGSVQTGTGRGVYNWLGDVYSIFGTTLYKNGVAVSGTLDATGGLYRFCQSCGATPRMQFGNGVATYNYDSGAGIVQITTTATVTAGAFLDGVSYTIATAGTTDFTLIGAANSTPGTVFTAGVVATCTFAAATMTVVAFTTGTSFAVGMEIASTGLAAGITITSFASGTGGVSSVCNLSATVGSAPARTVTVSGVGTGTGTATTPSNFPSATVKGIAYLDGTTYVMDSNASVRGCASLNDPTAWSDVLNRLTAQIEPDGGVALNKQLVYIIAFGQWSTEVFYDQMNPTASPLGPVQGAKINYGCASADSIQEIDGVLLWIATNRGAAVQILLVENLKPTIVSTKAIERLLGEADLSSVHSFGIKYEGHRFYGITLVNENITLVYDMTDQKWAQWTDQDGNYWPMVACSFSETVGPILQHESNGKLYQFDSEYTSDNGEYIVVDLYTPNFDGGVRRRKQLNVLEVIGDQTPGSFLQVRSNDSDYAADRWTNFRKVDLNLKKPMLVNNGSFMRRAYHFRHQCDTRMRIQGIELQLDIGTL